MELNFCDQLGGGEVFKNTPPDKLLDGLPGRNAHTPAALAL